MRVRVKHELSASILTNSDIQVCTFVFLESAGYLSSLHCHAVHHKVDHHDWEN